MPKIVRYIARLAVSEPITLEDAQEDAQNGRFYIMLMPVTQRISELGKTAQWKCRANDTQATYRWEKSTDGTTWTDAGSTTDTLSLLIDTQSSLATKVRCTVTFRDSTTDVSEIAGVEMEEANA